MDRVDRLGRRAWLMPIERRFARRFRSESHFNEEIAGKTFLFRKKFPPEIYRLKAHPYQQSIPTRTRHGRP